MWRRPLQQQPWPSEGVPLVPNGSGKQDEKREEMNWKRRKSRDGRPAGAPRWCCCAVSSTQIDEADSLRHSSFLQSAGAVIQKVSHGLVPPADDVEAYEDLYNDEPWTCVAGTKNDGTVGIWMNSGDYVGSIMAVTVWILYLYSIVTMILVTTTHHLRYESERTDSRAVPVGVTALYCTTATLALAAHAKTTLTDPGAVPYSAVPIPLLNGSGQTQYTMCSRCHTYKPPVAHHCRICDRCISRMDHHCPWMNNCVGALNYKHFILFLCYTWLSCVIALLSFGINYFFCTAGSCEFNKFEVHLVRFMTLIAIVALCLQAAWS
jgi:DHHC palmitoyltransferase